ncbi:Ig-like domain-containing protein [Methanobrevibacter sp.]|uniref:Ig-like domain-containing protein n=1 Tax=Methanobrevibacter sp. TaxID=66852 RepID=UPI00388E3662
MASVAELLTNFKTLMHQWFPFTTEMNSAINNVEDRIDDVALEIFKKTGVIDKLEACSTIVDLETVVHNELQILAESYEDWLSENGVEECILYAVTAHSYDNDTVFIVLDHFYFYDSAEGTVSLLNDYDVELEASSYNVNINGSVTLTATLTDQLGNPIPYKNVEIYKNGSSLSKGITNNKGIVMFTVTCNAEGLITFSAGNASIQVNVIYDTGWVDLSSQLYSTISAYENSASNKLKARRIGNIVHLRGTLTYTGTSQIGNGATATQIAHAISSEFRPITSERTLQQASGNKVFLFSVNSDGTLSVARTRNENGSTYIRNGEWINIFVTYMV